MKSKHTLVILSILFVLCFVLLYTTYITPITKSNIEKTQKVQENLSVLNSVQAISANDVQKDLSTLAKNKQKLDKVLPQEQKEEVIVTYFYDLIKKHNLTGNTIKFTKDNKEITASLSVTGSPSDVTEFLIELQNYKDSASNIQSINIATVDNKMTTDVKDGVASASATATAVSDGTASESSETAVANNKTEAVEGIVKTLSFSMAFLYSTD